MHLLFELFFTFYRPLFTLFTAPMVALFHLMDFLFNSYPNIGDALTQFFLLVFVATGFVFLAQLIHLFLKQNRKNVPTQNWRMIWGSTFLITVLLYLIIRVTDVPNSTLSFPPQWLMVILLCLGVIGIGACFYYLFKFGTNFILDRLSKGKHKELFQKHLPSLLFLVGIYPFILMAFIVVELTWQPGGQNSASQFFIVNAAIKNTCFIDPDRENCPHTLVEISYIEPKEYQKMMRGNQVQYVYYPDQNLYTLVVRYTPTRAVVFDWRLVEEYTMDLHEYDVQLIGQDRLQDPPEFDGPWTFPEWQY